MRIRKFFDFINENADSKFKEFFGKMNAKIKSDDSSLAKGITIGLEVPYKGALWISSIVESGADMSSSLYLMEIYDYDVNEFKKNPSSKNALSPKSLSKNGIGSGVAHYQKFWFDPEVLKKTGTREIKEEKEEVFVYPNSYDFIPELFVRIFNEIGPLHSGKIPYKIKDASDQVGVEFPEKFIQAYTSMISKANLSASEGYFKNARSFYTNGTLECIDSFNKSLLEINGKK